MNPHEIRTLNEPFLRIPELLKNSGRYRHCQSLEPFS